MATDIKPDLDARIERLERAFDALIELARTHPAGRVLLRKLGIR